MQSGQLIGLTLQTAVFLLLGLVVFNHSLQRVKLAGSWALIELLD
ncbi:MAG: hypothetical protein M5U34_37310 [Chloroflexi bacterium]|nr:hypothetical protein [Chloroflexota bacterium]